jgi:thiamine-phosphate pyrophosphorylase
MERHNPQAVVAANCGRVQEALRVLEEYSRSVDPSLASESAAIRYGLYDLEVTCLKAGVGSERRRTLNNCQLCLITTPCPDLIERVKQSLAAGITMVQYRCKSGNDRERLEEAKALRMLCRNHGALFVINDRIDLALAVDADGVHLGQDDLPTDVARGLIGEARLLGRSTNTLDDVRRADAEACDYLGLGPVHTTVVKPDKPAVGPVRLQEAQAITRLPVFAIGGIDLDNIAALLDVGCRRIAVIGAIMAAENPERASQQLLQALLPPVD